MGTVLLSPGSIGEALDRFASLGGDCVMVAPFITDVGAICSVARAGGKARLVTQVETGAIASGALSLQALKAALAAGVEVLTLPKEVTLHAKVYAFAHGHAIIGSANLTNKGLTHNIEAGVILEGEDAATAYGWALHQAGAAMPIATHDIADWQEGEFAPSPGGIRSRILEPSGRRLGHLPDLGRQVRKRLQLKLQGGAVNVFVCNSDQLHSTPPERRERLMLERGFAAAWEPFSGHGTMKSARPGDVVLLYRNGKSVLAAGLVLGGVVRLEPHEAGLVDLRAGSAEWQLPVAWFEFAPVNWDKVSPPTFHRPSEATLTQLTGVLQVLPS